MTEHYPTRCCIISNILLRRLYKTGVLLFVIPRSQPPGDGLASSRSMLLATEIKVDIVEGYVAQNLLVAVLVEVLLQRIVQAHALDDDQIGRKAFDVKTRKGLQLMAFDVHREQVDLLDPLSVQQIVKGDLGDFNLLCLQRGPEGFAAGMVAIRR